MEQAVDYYNDLADIIQQGIDNLRQRQQAQQPRRPPHPPLTITAEKLIAERKEDTVKLFTNFTIEQFEHIYSLVSEALAEGTHKDAMVTPKTKLLLTLLWCRFNETYKPMANRFGIKYTYMRGIVIQTIQRIHPVLEKYSLNGQVYHQDLVQTLLSMISNSFLDPLMQQFKGCIAEALTKRSTILESTRCIA